MSFPPKSIIPSESAINFAINFGHFVDSSPTPFHVCKSVANKLLRNGFTKLSERKPFQLAKNGKYFYTRNASTLVAFVVGGAFQAGNGFKVVGAHTDSPVLKIKPVSGREKDGYIQCGVEPYGGGLWHTWLDRDLGIAGTVIVKSPQESGFGENPKFRQRMVHIKRPIFRVPSLCIHLQSADERAALRLNKEDHLTPILGLINSEINKTDESLDPRHPPALLRILAEELQCDPADIVDLELTLTDTQPAAIGGVGGEFLFAPRLDNQMHCFTSSEALLEFANDSGKVANDEFVSLIALFDHEEVGSSSATGAGSPIMRDAVERISFSFSAAPNTELFKIGLDKSMLFSADGSHAIHPNYASKHEQKHQPKLNAGTVIKTNSNQRYSTNGVTGFVVREVAKRVNVEVQEFVVRSDCPCGSTIGPIIATNTGIRTVDIGIPQLSMHSIRETCGVMDLESNKKLLMGFFSHFKEIDESLAFEDIDDVSSL